ncbi:MAG TPA: hypothetical protein PKO15_03230 [Fibrobacteria bacterium]|nr:hypothetical protein [Fibrobacteria bacterium]
MAASVKQKYGVKSVDFISDDYIANNSIRRFKEIMMDPLLSIPQGPALDAWKKDPQYSIVEAKLKNQKGCMAAVEAARSLLLD